MTIVKSLTSLHSPADSLEPGDRFELVQATDRGRLQLAEFFAANVVPIEAVEDATGKVLGVRREPAANQLVLTEPERLTIQPRDTVWLEYREAGRFQLVVEPATPLATAPWQTDQGVVVEPEPADAELVHNPWRQHPPLAEFDLALQAARLSTHAGFDHLICLPLVREMELLEHQVRTAKTVLQRFRGRALLCDEVGLGKTIEAGLIFAELRMRGLIRSALVVVPPSLIEQWQGEMRRKFSLDLVSHDDPAFRRRGNDAWNEHDWVIVSMHTARREPHRSAILGRKWDLVIVDEAHHLRNAKTQLWRMASELRKEFILLLTATPVQNNLEELFNLVTLLEPGLLRTARQFQKQFVDRKDKLTPRNVDELHRLLSEVMVRNRRSTVGLQFTRRWARTTYVAPNPAEQALYADVAGFVREHLRGAGERTGLTRMALVALQMALGSSSQAAAGTLHRLVETPGLDAADRDRLAQLAARAQSQTAHSKVDQLLRILEEYPDKMVLFTQFRATQEMLQQRLQAAGHSLALFHGGLSRLAKEDAVRQFRGPARLLLATEAGSEGATCNLRMPCATTICRGTRCGSSSASAGSAGSARHRTSMYTTWWRRARWRRRCCTCWRRS